VFYYKLKCGIVPDSSWVETEWPRVAMAPGGPYRGRAPQAIFLNNFILLKKKSSIFSENYDLDPPNHVSGAAPGPEAQEECLMKY